MCKSVVVASKIYYRLILDGVVLLVIYETYALLAVDLLSLTDFDMPDQQ